MTSATEGGPGPNGGGDIELAPTPDRSGHPRLRWWLLPFVVVLVGAALAGWMLSGDGEPAAVVTATNVSTTSDVSTSTSTSTVPGDDASSAPTNPAANDSGVATTTDSANDDRPIVPGSTTTAPTTAPIPSSTVAPSTVAPSTIVVSGTADADAPQVSLVDDAVTEAIVIDVVPNTSLDAADRTTATPPPTTTQPALVCDAPSVQLDAAELVEAGRVTAENADGTAATMTVSALGVGVAGGRDAERIDYSADRGASERIFVDLGGPRCAIGITVADLADSEWNGVAESLHWVGLDADNRTVGEGWLLGPSDGPVELPVRAAADRLLVEAAPYGATAEGWPVGADRESTNNSDFVLVALIVR